MKLLWLIAAALACQGQTIQSLTAQIQRSPNAALYIDRGAAYLAAGDARNAVSDLDRALDRDALNIRALTLRGQANTRLGRHADAITDYSGAIALTPSDAKLYAARSAAYAAAGDERRAAEDRAEALRLDPQAAVAVAAIPSQPPAPVATVTPEPAALPAKPIAPPKPSAPPPVPSGNVAELYQRGRTLLDQGKLAEGNAALTEAIRLDPRNAVLYNTRGYGYFRARDYKRAIADYDEAIRLNPEYFNAFRNRAVARRSAGDKAGYDADRKREIELGRKLGIPAN